MSAERGSNPEKSGRGNKKDRQVPPRGDRRVTQLFSKFSLRKKESERTDHSPHQSQETPRQSERSIEAQHAAIQQVVRDAADQILLTLDERGGEEKRDVCGLLVHAVAQTEGVPAAHEYAANAIETLALEPENEFGVWIDLAKAGDITAIPLAHNSFARLSAIEAPFFLEAGIVDVGSLHHAERAVQLVEAGEMHPFILSLARSFSLNVPLIEKAALYSRLYCAGDDSSLLFAIEAAQESKIATELNDTPQYARTEHALVSMSKHAIKQGKFADALHVIEFMDSESDRAIAHSELYKYGHEESLSAVQAYLGDAPSLATKVIVTRALAEGGHESSIKKVRDQVESRLHARFAEGASEDLDLFENLVSLHHAGDTSVNTIAESLYREENTPRYCRYLERTGRSEEAKEFAEAFSSEQQTIWEAVFAHLLYENKNPQQAADHVSELAERMNVS